MVSSQFLDGEPFRCENLFLRQYASFVVMLKLKDMFSFGHSMLIITSLKMFSNSRILFGMPGQINIRGRGKYQTIINERNCVSSCSFLFFFVCHVV